MILRWKIFIFLILLGGPVVQAETDRQMRRAIQDVLSQRHPTEGEAWWRALGKNAPKVVTAMFKETEALYQKLRLVEALGYFDDPDAVKFLKSLFMSTTNSVVRQSVLRSLAMSQKMKEESFLTEALSDSDPHTRLAAALALRGTGEPNALTIVDNYKKGEKTAWVLTRLNAKPISPGKIDRQR